MFQASSDRATAPRRTARDISCLLAGCAAAAVLIAAGLQAGPAAAQQYGTNSSVTVDYSVLDSVGPDPNLPALLGGGAPQQPAPAAPYRSGAYPEVYPPSGPLLAPPPSAPRSRLTTDGPAGASEPGRITLIPPSQVKKAAPTAAPLPTPAVPPQPTRQAAAEPTPPPAPPSSETAAAAPEPQPESEPEPAAEPATAAAPEPEPAAPADTAETAAPEPTAPPTEAAEAEPAAPPAEAAEAEPAAPPAEAAPADDEPGEDSQSAALPASTEGQITVTFPEGSSELSPAGQSALDALAEKLRGDTSLRIQLLAYAQAIDDNTSRARRTSLSRALEVRSYLIERGVPSTRMDVRALGSNVEGEPADRVDIIPQPQ